MPRLLVTSDAAADRLKRARAWLTAQPRDREVLVVGAGLEAVDAFCRPAPDERGDDGPRFGWHRLTLDGLAHRLAQLPLARRGLCPASGLARQALCARVMRTEAVHLGPWGEVTASAGWARALAHTLDDLSGLGDEAAAPPAPLDHLLAAYRRALVDHGLADRAMRLSTATETAREGDHPLLGLPVLWLDVAPPDRLSVALVAAVTARSPDVLAIAPADDPVAQAGMRDALRVEATRVASELPGALGRVHARLFRPDSPEPQPEEDDDAVVFSSSPGESREAVEIARRILALAAEDTPLERIAILCRNPEAYRAPLVEALRRARIPAYFTGGAERPHPEGRALLSLLACRAEQLSASRFAEYLSLGVVPRSEAPRPPDWVPPADVGLPLDERDEPTSEEEPTAVAAPHRWEQQQVGAAVVGHPIARWERRHDGLAESLAREARHAEDPVDQARLERQRIHLGTLRERALPILRRLAQLPEEAPWRDWLAALEGLCGEAIHRPQRVLEILAELRPLSDIGPVDLDEVRLVLDERLSVLRAAPEGKPAGRVFVAGVDHARGRRFDVVFVPGLAEKVFPPLVREDPLLLDAARATLHPSLTVTADRIAQERARLRLTVGAAERRLFLSYPRLDEEKARPRVPSFYALELLRAAEGHLPRFDELAARDRDASAAVAARMGWPAPPDPADAIDDAEYDLAVLGRLFDADAATRQSAAAYLVHENAHLARALRFRARRWSKKGWTGVDGFAASSDTTKRLLREAYGLDHRPYAPTTLEHYSRCPYRFYLRAIAGLSPRERPEALDQLDARHRGQLIHTVQSRLFRTLESEGSLPLSLADLEAATQRLERVLAETAAEYVDSLAPAIERVFDDTVAQIRADLRQWLAKVIDDAHFRPIRFELGFGLDRAGRDLDPRSRTEPVPVGQLRIRGAIDWVEDDGQQLRATDHKTGTRHTDQGIRVDGGRVLQPLLYALVLEHIEGPGRVSSGRLYYCTERGGFEEVVVPLDPAGRRAMDDFAALLAQSFDHGFFPAAPEPDACTHCDHRVVCGPLEEQRTKTKRALPQLERLRRLR